MARTYEIEKSRNLVIRNITLGNLTFLSTVKLGDKELFGHPKIVP